MAGERPRATERRTTQPRRKPFPVSWDQFHRDSRALAWRLQGGRAVRGRRRDHPRRAGAGRDRGARAQHPHDRYASCVASYDHQTRRASIQVLKAHRPTTSMKLGGGTGKEVLIVDDLVDTGKTAPRRARHAAGRAFRHRLRQAQGPPLVDTFITEVSQDTWIFFPWDTALSFHPPMRERRGIGEEEATKQARRFPQT